MAPQPLPSPCPPAAGKLQFSLFLSPVGYRKVHSMCLLFNISTPTGVTCEFCRGDFVCWR